MRQVLDSRHFEIAGLEYCSHDGDCIAKGHDAHSLPGRIRERIYTPRTRRTKLNGGAEKIKYVLEKKLISRRKIEAR